MIRTSEAVLDGHPDKFCDQVADRIIAEAYSYDPQAYGQVEVAVWSDRIWLSGALVTRTPFGSDLLDLVHEVGLRVGYTPENHIDVTRYQLDNHLCLVTGDPRQWTEHVNDQSIVIGWAGYDDKTRYLAPEHYLAHALRETLVDEIRDGQLAGEGPDGKLLVRIREEGCRWILEHVLVTLQHRERTSLLGLAAGVAAALEAAYAALQSRDPRWCAGWDEVEVLINPNGPLLNGGSDGDNGQTGCKLVMDFYGPRIPIGGGALSGKDLSHIDRAGAYAAREAAVELVRTGAAESCQVVLAYAPNLDEPLDVRIDGLQRGRPSSRARFNHSEIRRRFTGDAGVAQLGRGTHFYDTARAWNSPATSSTAS